MNSGKNNSIAIYKSQLPVNFPDKLVMAKELKKSDSLNRCYKI